MARHPKRCMQLNPERTQACGSAATCRVRGYYATGVDLLLCDGHGRAYARTHPLDTPPTRLDDGTEVRHA